MQFVKHRFSLVEMLVVIGIIMILMGLLLPALKRPYITARTTTCINNLKQQGLAVFMYTHESDGILPQIGNFAVRGDKFGNANWKLQIAVYLGLPATISEGTESWPAKKKFIGSGVFACPEWANEKITEEASRLSLLEDARGEANQWRYAGGYGYPFGGTPHYLGYRQIKGTIIA